MLVSYLIVCQQYDGRDACANVTASSSTSPPLMARPRRLRPPARPRSGRPRPPRSTRSSSASQRERRLTLADWTVVGSSARMSPPPSFLLEPDGDASVTIDDEPPTTVTRGPAHGARAVLRQHGLYAAFTRPRPSLILVTLAAVATFLLTEAWPAITDVGGRPRQPRSTGSAPRQGRDASIADHRLPGVRHRADLGDRAAHRDAAVDRHRALHLALRAAPARRRARLPHRPSCRHPLGGLRPVGLDRACSRCSSRSTSWLGHVLRLDSALRPRPADRHRLADGPRRACRPPSCSPS